MSRAERAAAALNDVLPMFCEEDHAGLTEIAMDYFTNDGEEEQEEESDTEIDGGGKTTKQNKENKILHYKNEMICCIGAVDDAAQLVGGECSVYHDTHSSK